MKKKPNNSTAMKLCGWQMAAVEVIEKEFKGTISTLLVAPIGVGKTFVATPTTKA